MGTAVFGARRRPAARGAALLSQDERANPAGIQARHRTDQSIRSRLQIAGGRLSRRWIGCGRSAARRPRPAHGAGGLAAAPALPLLTRLQWVVLNRWGGAMLWRSTPIGSLPPSGVLPQIRSADPPTRRSWTPLRVAARAAARADRGAAVRPIVGGPGGSGNSATGVTDSHGLCAAICHRCAGRWFSQRSAPRRTCARVGLDPNRASVHDDRAQRGQAGTARHHQYIAALAVDLHRAVWAGQSPPVTHRPSSR